MIGMTYISSDSLGIKGFLSSVLFPPHTYISAKNTASQLCRSQRLQREQTHAKQD